MKIRAWVKYAAAKIAALELLFADYLGWLALADPIYLPALIIVRGITQSIAIIVAASVFFKATAKIATFEVVKIFFDEDDHEKVQDKMARTINATFWWRNYEWLMTSLTIAEVSALKYFNFFGITAREPVIFLILWMLCVFESAPSVIIGDRNKIDITTMEGRRRLFNALYKTSGRPVRVLLALFEIGYGVRLILWDGPNWFFLFFRKPNKRWLRWGEIVLYVAATGIQMAVWTKIYCYGYESAADAIKQFF